mmetsp:Transcript_7932/g.28224  ORF Transcript_7932/g.28224 Transcript_7932/m.28224 type:complete len:359 (+) Transcript_7932:2116-3192(+)
MLALSCDFSSVWRVLMSYSTSRRWRSLRFLSVDDRGLRMVLVTILPIELSDVSERRRCILDLPFAGVLPPVVCSMENMDDVFLAALLVMLPRRERLTLGVGVTSSSSEMWPPSLAYVLIGGGCVSIASPKPCAARPPSPAPPRAATLSPPLRADVAPPAPMMSSVDVRLRSSATTSSSSIDAALARPGEPRKALAGESEGVACSRVSVRGPLPTVGSGVISSPSPVSPSPRRSPLETTACPSLPRATLASASARMVSGFKPPRNAVACSGLNRLPPPAAPAPWPSPLRFAGVRAPALPVTDEAAVAAVESNPAPARADKASSSVGARRGAPVGAAGVTAVAAFDAAPLPSGVSGPEPA